MFNNTALNAKYHVMLSLVELYSINIK